jgi:hypothetical protein
MMTIYPFLSLGTTTEDTEDTEAKSCPFSGPTLRVLSVLRGGIGITRKRS